MTRSKLSGGGEPMGLAALTGVRRGGGGGAGHICS